MLSYYQGFVRPVIGTIENFSFFFFFLFFFAEGILLDFIFSIQQPCGSFIEKNLKSRK